MKVSTIITCSCGYREEYGDLKDLENPEKISKLAVDHMENCKGNPNIIHTLKENGES